MGTMNFLLPATVSPNVATELARAYVAGGPDGMPWPTETAIENGHLLVRRAVDESGSVHVPWEVNGRGRYMVSTATLVERADPYCLQVELARGKVNQLRNQAADWETSGLKVPPELLEKLRQVNQAFARTAGQGQEAGSLADETLAQAACTAEELVQAYVEQVFHARHQRQGRLDTAYGCHISATPPDEAQTALLRETFNTIRIPFNWSDLEPMEADYNWQPYDALVRWAKDSGFAVCAGPLVDFSRSRMPEWLWLYEKEPQHLANLMCSYVERTLRRYHREIPIWEITTASNYASILSLQEDEMLWLTVRLLEVARDVNRDLQLVVGIAQPWGEYMAVEDRAHSPFVFADTLLRTGITFSAFDLELVMGVRPRGSYVRDLLDASRLLDLYAILGHPIRVTLGCPSASAADERADKEFAVTPRGQAEEWSPQVQAAWARQFAALAICKPYMQAVDWTHCFDAQPHVFPHCGLVDATGTPKPVLGELKRLREEHVV